jgi:hypothetical protein
MQVQKMNAPAEATPGDVASRNAALIAGWNGMKTDRDLSFC